MWPLAALSRWLPYRGKIYSKMHWGDLRVAAMDRWPPYGGGREGRFDCISLQTTPLDNDVCITIATRGRASDHGEMSCRIDPSW